MKRGLTLTLKARCCSSLEVFSPAVWRTARKHTPYILFMLLTADITVLRGSTRAAELWLGTWRVQSATDVQSKEIAASFTSLQWASGTVCNHARQAECQAGVSIVKVNTPDHHIRLKTFKIKVCSGSLSLCPFYIHKYKVLKIRSPLSFRQDVKYLMLSIFSTLIRKHDIDLLKHSRKQVHRKRTGKATWKIKHPWNKRNKISYALS